MSLRIIKQQHGGSVVRTKTANFTTPFNLEAEHTRSTPYVLTFHNKSPRHIHCLTVYQRELKFTRKLNKTAYTSLGCKITYLRLTARLWANRIPVVGPQKDLKLSRWMPEKRGMRLWESTQTFYCSSVANCVAPSINSLQVSAFLCHLCIPPPGL